MLDRIKGEIVFECDGPKCNEYLETETRDFTEAKEQLNEAGWRTSLDARIWVHTCPTCLEAEIGGTL